MLQIILTLAIFVILVIPMGKYMYHIATKQKTFADKVFNPIDRCIYKVCGIKGEDMGWKKYALTLLLVNAVMVFVGYAILRLQSILFLNPNGISNMEPTLSFNTIISFMTNTNLQHYSGESGLSYVAQMCVIIFMMFTSAATGYHFKLRVDKFNAHNKTPSFTVTITGSPPAGAQIFSASGSMARMAVSSLAI